MQEVKLVKEGGHQSENPVEKKDIATVKVSEMGGQLERREAENGGTSVGRAQKEGHVVKQERRPVKGWGI